MKCISENHDFSTTLKAS